jgi:hypothetical protein
MPFSYLRQDSADVPVRVRSGVPEQPHGLPRCPSSVGTSSARSEPHPSGCRSEAPLALALEAAPPLAPRLTTCERSESEDDRSPGHERRNSGIDVTVRAKDGSAEHLRLSWFLRARGASVDSGEYERSVRHARATAGSSPP